MAVLWETNKREASKQNKISWEPSGGSTQLHWRLKGMKSMRSMRSRWSGEIPPRGPKRWMDADGIECAATGLELERHYDDSFTSWIFYHVVIKFYLNINDNFIFTRSWLKFKYIKGELIYLEISLIQPWRAKRDTIKSTTNMYANGIRQKQVPLNSSMNSPAKKDHKYNTQKTKPITTMAHYHILNTHQRHHIAFYSPHFINFQFFNIQEYTYKKVNINACVIYIFRVRLSQTFIISLLLTESWKIKCELLFEQVLKTSRSAKLRKI